LILKVVGEVQHAKKRSQVSFPEVVEPVNGSSSKTATNETAATKKTNSSSARNIPKIPKVPAALGINQMIAPRQTFARKSLPPGENTSFM
jgi:hypothetical protein